MNRTFKKACIKRCIKTIKFLNDGLIKLGNRDDIISNASRSQLIEMIKDVEEQLKELEESILC